MINPFLRHSPSNRVLATESAVLQELMRRRRFRSGVLDASSVNDSPQVQVPMFEQGSVALDAAPFPTTKIVPIVDFQLQEGFDAIITSVANAYEGATGGQVDGDGQLRWYLIVDGRFVQQLAPIIGQSGITLHGVGGGSGTTPVPPISLIRGIPVFSGQRITLGVLMQAVGMSTAGCRSFGAVNGVKIPTTR